MSSIEVNDIRIYYEKRGRGPAVLFVSGATGDAGHWTKVADILADAYTVITYDRRGNSRSPRPPGWASTTIGEQADDAAALLHGLDLVPAVVLGTSAAAGILADLCLRHPDVVHGAVFHEPLFQSGVSNPGAVRAGRKALVEEGMAKGGPRAATELFLRSVAGDEVYQSLDPQLRERLLGNAEVLFGIEMAPYLAYEPTPDQLAAIPVPRAVTAGAEGHDSASPGHWRYEAAQWLAAHLRTTVIELPGAHMGYLGHPGHFAKALRPILDKLTDVRQPAGGAPAAPSAARIDRDIYRLAPTVDAGVLAAIAERLEFRGQDEGYARLSQAYFGRLPLARARRILALGCGTGMEVRALKRLTGPEAAIVGVDHSPVLIDAARRLTAEEGLYGNVTYQTGDAHHLPYGDDDFDIVTLHTLISHVDDPLQVLREARRVVRPGGTVAIFDGDYASLTFAYPDPALARTIEDKLIQLIAANPRIMRDMPRLLPAAGLKLAEADGTLYPNIGTGGFWPAAAESYGPLLARSGLLPQAIVEDWQAFQARAVQSNTFFAASSYYTYLARRPS